MNREKLRQFASLLEQQRTGDAEAVALLRDLKPELSEGCCLFNLYEQWTQAFSYEPGRQEALSPITGLAKKLIGQSADDTMFLFAQPEWAALVELRGPAEVIHIYECVRCRTRSFTPCTSGFYDGAGLVCSKCGNVYFRSLRAADDGAVKCECGGCFQKPSSEACASCGEKKMQFVSSVSPFEYFATHKFQRGPGA